MPWMIPSHQAPVLPLKRWRPHWFSGLALVLGTVAPDLAFVLRLDANGSPLSHSAVGLFVVDVPLAIVLHVLATRLVLPWLLPHLPGGPPLHLHALARCGTARDAFGVWRVALSALVGAATHVFIDGFTHGDHAGWALAFLPALGAPVLHLAGTAPFHDALQFWLTIGLGAVALRDWGRMASALPVPGPGAAATWEVVEAPPATRRRVVAILGGAALAGAALAPVLRGAIGSPDALELAAYGAITFAALAALLGAVSDRARRVIGRVLLDINLSPGANGGAHGRSSG
jgi:hypothetical protein